MELKTKIPISEIVKKTKHLEIKAKKMVNSVLQSDYKSSFKGSGIEFEEVRPYIIGDNVRDIDWNVTAKMNEPFVKIFQEERELLTYLIVDISGSSDFGQTRSKRSIMADIIAILGFISFFSKDKTGLILISDSIEYVINPECRYANILKIIRAALYFEPKVRKTNLSTSLKNVLNLIKKRSVIFLLSDFFDNGYDKMLGALAKKHDLIPIVVRDYQEDHLHSPSILPIMMQIQDLETREETPFSLYGSSNFIHEKYAQSYRQIFRKIGLNYGEIRENSDYVQSIDKLLRQHTSKK